MSTLRSVVRKNKKEDATLHVWLYKSEAGEIFLVAEVSNNPVSRRLYDERRHTKCLQEDSVRTFVTKLRGQLAPQPHNDFEELCAWVKLKFPAIPEGPPSKKRAATQPSSDESPEKRHRSKTPSTVTSCQGLLGSANSLDNNQNELPEVRALTPDDWQTRYDQLREAQTTLDHAQKKVKQFQNDPRQARWQSNVADYRAELTEMEMGCAEYFKTTYEAYVKLQRQFEQLQQQQQSGRGLLNANNVTPMPVNVYDAGKGPWYSANQQAQLDQNSCGNGEHGGSMRVLNTKKQFQQAVMDTKASLRSIWKALGDKDELRKYGYNNLFVERGSADAAVNWLRQELISGKAFEVQTNEISVVDYLQKVFSPNKAFCTLLMQQKPQKPQ